MEIINEVIRNKSNWDFEKKNNIVEDIRNDIKNILDNSSSITDLRSSIYDYLYLYINNGSLLEFNIPLTLYSRGWVKIIVVFKLQSNPKKEITLTIKKGDK